MSSKIESNDPEALEREADARRANLNRTLDAVEQRFSPNHLMQQTVDYFGEHGGDIAQLVSRSIKSESVTTDTYRCWAGLADVYTVTIILIVL